ncbi:MAG: ATP-binding protein [Solirubrobacterales bacterium]
MSDGVALSWSGGKDSSLALWVMREELGVEPVALLTTMTEDHGRVSMHGVRRELVHAQAEAVGLPLVEVAIPAVCTNETYEARMAATLAAPPLDAVGTFAFADLYLADIRAYREERLAAIGRRAIFPLWGRDTAALAARFVAAGFEATLACVDPRSLDRSFAGRSYDEALLRDLPEGVDPCGEDGEFHTFVSAGPIFSAPIAIERGETVERDGFVFTDLLPAQPRAAAADRSPRLA